MQKPEVLYVDDNSTNLFLFESLFGSKYSVVTVDGGKNGLEILEDNTSIRVVFSDMKMPDMNGLEFVTKAKELYPDKKYIIITGFNITTEIELAISDGIIDQFMQKPFQFTQIENTIINSLQ
ncbi:MAG: response regulator [Salinivirgaceae bacterium]|nr:MAG: response regulator [Salinivirgaceae bacterium]